MTCIHFVQYIWQDEEEMICAQVTPCGHIFCSPCLARYCVDEEGVLSFHLDKKCPICYAKFSPSTVRSVKFRIVTKPAAGEEFTFSLLKRRRGSTIPVPVVRESGQDTRLLEVSRSPRCKSGGGGSRHIFPPPPPSLFVIKSPI